MQKIDEKYKDEKYQQGWHDALTKVRRDVERLIEESDFDESTKHTNTMENKKEQLTPSEPSATGNVAEELLQFLLYRAGHLVSEETEHRWVKWLEKQKEPHYNESEDERIRTRFIEYFQGFLEGYEDCYKDGGYVRWEGLDVKSILAWLEKQKELTKENVIKELEKEFYACSTTPKWFHKTVQDAINIGKAEAFREIQKEYDRVREKEIEDIDYGIAVEELEKQKENPKSCDSIPSGCTSDAKCEDRWQKVADSLPGNPREVLCRDEAGNFFIGRYYVGEGWEISNYDDEDKPHHLNPPVSKWIDFPSEKQKEQKQEWSEEDEDNLKRVIRVLEDNDSDWKELTDWLKSLRPSWKPSEEQMKKEAARLYAIPHYTKDIDKSHIDEYPYDSGLEYAFIAGAEWQKEQDTRDMYMSDNRHIQKVYELGKKDMKEQMMKEGEK